MLAALRSFGGLFGDRRAAERDIRKAPLSVPVDFDPEARLGRWLPYDSYDPIRQIFINLDSIGFALEFQPQTGADDSMAQTLHSIYQRLPDDACVQISMFGSPQVRDVLRNYAELRMTDADAQEKSIKWGRPARNENIYRAMARRFYDYMQRGSHHPLLHRQAPLFRDLRGVLSVTVPGGVDDLSRMDQVVGFREAVSTTLRSAGLPNRVWNAGDLINWVATLLNPDRLHGRVFPLAYDDGREIRYQCVALETHSDSKDPTRLRLENVGRSGEEIHVRSFSIRRFPEQFALWQMGALIGDSFSPTLHYPVPFVITMGAYVPNAQKSGMTLLGESIKGEADARSDTARFTPALAMKKRDQDLARQALDRGERILDVYHKILVFAERDQLETASSAADDIWRARGFELELEPQLQRQSLIASLPLALGPSLHSDLKKCERLSRKTSGNAVHLSPLIGDWKGTRTPLMLLVSRHGQLISLDLYDNVESNKNFVIAGTTGSGKSATLNMFAASYASAGAKVWVLEPGNSFNRTCTVLRGQKVAFDKRDNGRLPCINPFSMVIDLKDDMKMLQPVVAKMAAPFQELDPVQYKALGVAIMKNFQKYGREMDVTALRDTFKAGRLDLDDVDPQTLNEDPRLDQTLAHLSRADVDQRLLDLATLLSDWSKGGQYEDFVNGRHTVNFDNDFVYVETEGLQGDKALATVAQLIVIYRITQEMYFTGKERRKVFLVDEVRKMLGGFSEQDLAMLHMVTDLYLRVRKYNGAMGSATQSMSHYLETAAARSIYDGADFKIWLCHEPDAIELLASKRELDINEGMKFALKSMDSSSPHYKDCYIKSTLGSGPGRIFMDPFTRLLFSNRAEDNVPIDRRVAAGMDYVQAIDDLLASRSSTGGLQ